MKALLRELRDIGGLRFPDIALVRMFFREGLDKTPGSVLELGCGNGNNLALFRAFGWRVVGLDISRDALADARQNFSDDDPGMAEFLEVDLRVGLPELTDSFDAIILPSVNYYIPRASFRNVLSDCDALLSGGGFFYLRSRTDRDWRFGRGEETEPDGFVLDVKETGEFGCLNVFYREEDLLDIVESNLGKLTGLQVLRVRFELPMGGTIVVNDDLIVCGRKYPNIV